MKAEAVVLGETGRLGEVGEREYRGQNASPDCGRAV